MIITDTNEQRKQAHDQKVYNAQTPAERAASVRAWQARRNVAQHVAEMLPTNMALIVRTNYGEAFTMTESGAEWLLNQFTEHNRKRLAEGGTVGLWSIGVCWYGKPGEPNPIESRDLQSRIERRKRGEWREAV